MIAADTGVVVAAPILRRTKAMRRRFRRRWTPLRAPSTRSGWRRARRTPAARSPTEGNPSREQLRGSGKRAWKTRIAEPEPSKGYLRWHGDEAARKAVYANRVRLRSDIGRETMRQRSRPFAHVLDRGRMRRAWLRGRENLHKRYLIHVAGFNLGVLMRALYGQGTPREAAEAVSALIFVLQSDAALAFAGSPPSTRNSPAIVIVASDPTRA